MEFLAGQADDVGVRSQGLQVVEAAKGGEEGFPAGPATRWSISARARASGDPDVPCMWLLR
jgi:hypothetical protein